MEMRSRAESAATATAAVAKINNTTLDVVIRFVGERGRIIWERPRFLKAQTDSLANRILHVIQMIVHSTKLEKAGWFFNDHQTGRAMQRVLSILIKVIARLERNHHENRTRKPKRDGTETLHRA